MTDQKNTNWPEDKRRSQPSYILVNNINKVRASSALEILSDPLVKVIHAQLPPEISLSNGPAIARRISDAVKKFLANHATTIIKENEILKATVSELLGQLQKEENKLPAVVDKRYMHREIVKAHLSGQLYAKKGFGIPAAAQYYFQENFRSLISQTIQENHTPEDHAAMNIVNQLYDLAEVPVKKRQEINDEADQFLLTNFIIIRK